MSRSLAVVCVFVVLSMLLILALFIVLPNSGPFDSGVTPSLVDK